MSEYTVLVGNVGTVHRGNDRPTAEAIYNQYVELSVSGLGRAAFEDVTLLRDGEPMLEHRLHNAHDDIEQWCDTHKAECCAIVQRLACDLLAPDGRALDREDEFMSGSDFIDIFVRQSNLHGLYQIIYPNLKPSDY